MSVYKIYKEGCDDCYIGSSVNIKRRIIKHKSRCHNENDINYNMNLYKFIRENGGWDEWSYKILIHTDIVDNRRQLEKIEQDIINKYKPTLNGKKAFTTEEERKDYEKEWYKNNKERIKEYSKEYKAKNKDIIKEKNKKYREKNKEQINQKYREKVECDICSSIVSRDGLTRHKKRDICKNSII